MHFGTDEYQWIPVEHVPQILVYLFLQVVLCFVFVFFFDGFPFVYGDHNWPSFFYYIPEQGEIFDLKGRERIHHVHNDVTLFYMQHRANLNFAKVFILITVKIGSVQPSGVYELDAPAFI